jgi:succinate dehydrogenase/fumarate reductase flavoprotein subunit
MAGEQAALYARGKGHSSRSPQRAAPEFLLEGMEPQDAARLARIRLALEGGCGAVREAQGLQAAVAQLTALHEEIRAEGRPRSWIGRAAVVALAIAKSAAAREESRGDHFRLDHPRRDDRSWLGNLHLRADTAAGVRATYRVAGITMRSSPPDAARQAGESE